MRIDAPKITGSFQIGETAFPDLSSLATTSSINNMMDIVATTGSNTFVGSQTISGSITPAVNDTYDLGSPTHQFRHVYISSGSLYIDGTKVLGSTSQELQITTDVGQSFKVLESGADTITLQSADGNITVATSGGGDVILDPNTGIIALKGTTQVYAGNKILSSDGNNIQFGNGVTVSGSMVVTGYIETQELRTTYISSSILYRSGSTKFGDELTDTHSFTGSLLVSGSVSAIGSDLVSGSSQVNVMSTTNIAQLATTGSNTFTGNQTLSNGQYLRGIRNSGALSINLLGIESGSDRTLMTATGDFVIQNGSLTSMLTLTTSGAPTFANQVIVANGATTGTYGFRHEGAGVWTRMGVPNNSYAYWETNANNGFYIDGNLRVAGTMDIQKNQNATSNFYVKNTDTTDASSRAYFNVVAGNTSMSMLALHGGDTYLAGTSGRNMYFQQNPGGTVNMFISGSGYVGVNDSSPTKRLTVNFGSSISDGLLVTGSQRQETIFKSSGEHSNVFIDSAHSNIYLPTLGLRRNSTSYGEVKLQRASNSDSLGAFTESEMIIGSTTTVPVSIKTNEVRRVIIESGGNVNVYNALTVSNNIQARNFNKYIYTFSANQSYVWADVFVNTLSGFFDDAGLYRGFLRSGNGAHYNGYYFDILVGSKGYGGNSSQYRVQNVTPAMSPYVGGCGGSPISAIDNTGFTKVQNPCYEVLELYITRLG